MSTENIAAFAQKLQENPGLQAEVSEVQRTTQQKLAEQIAALSAEKGFPFTAEEFLSQTASQEMSDEQLQGVSGGILPLIAASIVAGGLGYWSLKTASPHHARLK